MNYLGPLSEAILIRRENRFVATVEYEGQQITAHVPNSGRCRELLYPGNTVIIQKATPNAHRKTEYSVILARHRRIWVCLVSAWANTLAREAAQLGLLPELNHYTNWQPEVKWGRSRLDFFLSAPGETPCLVEVKGVTLVPEPGQALFPDAPTLRGARHLGELTQAVRDGNKAAVVFAVQREDAQTVSPNREMDPNFTQALKEAEEAGVLLLAFSCNVSLDGITPVKSLKVEL